MAAAGRVRALLVPTPVPCSHFFFLGVSRTWETARYSERCPAPWHGDTEAGHPLGRAPWGAGSRASRLSLKLQKVTASSMLSDFKYILHIRIVQ